MKFGETLWQRSVPEWRSYNFDYGHIKKLIKEHTTPSQSRPVAIPGSSGVVAEHFENQLLSAIAAENDRLTRFVKSKYYEINSRLGSIERQFAQVQRRMALADQPASSVNLRRKFSRIETETLKVGEEIQHLSRFISINRLAIRKLLKKYRKWTGSTTLTAKVETQVLNQPDGFAKAQLKPALDTYIAYLELVRSPFVKQPESPAVTGQVPVDPLHPTVLNLLHGSPLEFDMALSMAPAGPRTEQAVYWVHQDNVVELRVLLMQYTRSTPSSSPAAPGATPPTSAPTSPNRSQRSRHNDSLSTMVVDNANIIAQSFCGSQGMSSGTRLWRPSVMASWTPAGDAIVAMNDSGESSPGLLVAKPRRSLLSSFLDTDTPFPPPDHNIDTDEDDRPTTLSDSHQESVAVRQKLARFGGVVPMVKISKSRSRFVGLDNTSEQGIWAALDEEIYMETSSKDALKEPDYFSRPARGETRFPYAVMTLRREGDDGATLVRSLDSSHLTERVSDFSLEAHAVMACHDLPAATRPDWFRKLGKDIRHIPSGQDLSRRSSAYGFSSTTLTPRNDERSAASVSDGPVASPEGRIRAIGAMTDAKKMGKKLDIVPAQQRYWNEYDDPQSDDDAGAFVIYIDPNEPVFPGQKALQRLGRKIKNVFVGSKRRKLDAGAEAGLLSVSPTDSAGFAPTLSASSSEDEDNHAKIRYARRKSRLLSRGQRAGTGSAGYGTLDGSSASKTEEASLSAHTASVPLCLLAAGIILAIVMVLTSTSRRKVRSEVQAVAIAGVAASLAFAGIAVCLWVHARLVGMQHGRSREGTTARLCGIGGQELSIMLGAVVAVGICVGDVWVLVDMIK